MTVLVFANGEIDEVVWIRPHLEEVEAIIAADGGLRHLLALDRLPDVIIGDMDSLPPEAQELPEAAAVPRIVYPAAKNETDLELALLYAQEAYQAADIFIFGGTGGRLDQTLANVLLPAHPQLAARRIVFFNSAAERAWLIRDESRIEGRPGDLVSLVPLGGPVHVLETSGLQWPLIDEMLHFGPARGISNVMTASEAIVRIATGFLLCVHTRYTN